MRIMVIDDNPAIHHDFIKVLSTSSTPKEMKAIEQQLFDDIEDPTLTDNPDEQISLPELIIDTASQGKEAVKKIKNALKGNKHYALAFVDIRMPPGWDGIETIKHMWKIDPDIQMVICTAYSDYTWEETVAQLGMGDNYLILKKPFDSVAVRQLAAALTQKWLLTKKVKKHTENLQEKVEEKTESLNKSLSLLRSTIESSADGIFVVDLKDNIIDYNNKFGEILSIPKSKFKSQKGKKIFDYLQEKLSDKSRFSRQRRYLEKNIDKSNRFIISTKTDQTFECYSQPHFLKDQIVGRVWSFRDITKQAQLEKQLEYQATHDALTGLPNRILLTDRIHQNIQTASRQDQKFAVLFFDLDRFKLINDSLSHEAGDNLLCLIAERLYKAIRREDTLTRLSGDEFVMVIPGFTDETHIINIANKLLKIFETPFKICNREINMSTSIGISLFPSDGKTFNSLLKCADMAMYRAKDKGGNQFQFYTPKLNQLNQKRFKLESELSQAIKKEQFLLYYQPQYDVYKKQLLSVEALLRWNHPKKGLLLPIDFIPTAEETGLIIPIGEWVARRACKQLNTWKKRGLENIRVAINVATQQLKQADFAEKIKEILEEYKIDPADIDIEITENVVITHTEIISMINQLKYLGLKIVLDDFGTGNSSLNYLHQIPIDRLKIDQSFVRNISTSRSDEVIIEAIIAMAKSFNFRVLAEGVENKNQISFLKKHQCNEVQGFYFSKPVTAAEFESLYNNALKRSKSY